LSYDADNSVKNALIDPVTMSFDLSTPKPYARISQGHSPHQLWTLCSMGGIIRFWVMLQTNTQTNKQMDSFPHRPTKSA